MLIPEEKVQEILERTDIVGLVGARVELKRAGRSLKGLCPFHGERTPSFTVNPDRKRFKCFGCGAGGDAIAFVMKSDGKSFVEAARELAALTGVRLDDAGDDKLAREKLNHRRVHQLATRFFEERLWDQAAGQTARGFLKQRGLTAETVKRFSLGYAPAGWGDFAARAAAEGQLELALAVGLVNARQTAVPAAGAGKGPLRTYDFFRGRLMIPIRNPEGATVAFGGRVLQGDDPRKFINSRESPIYKKGELLYGIDQAASTIRKTGQALLVEGYFDAILLHQAGLTNAVALCSASLTAEQVKLLRRFEARELVLILDGDDAGRRGVTRAAGALLAGAMPTRVMVLPTGKDPDDHVLEVGAERFKAEVAAAVPMTDHLVRAALPRGETASLSYEARLKGLAELRPILAQIPEGLERALFLKTLAERLGVPEGLLQSHLQGQVPQALPRRGDPPPAAGAPASAPTGGTARAAAPATKAPPPQSKLLPEEALLFAHLLHDPELARLPQAQELDQLSHLGLRAAAGAFQQAILDGQPLARGELLGSLDPALRSRVEDLLGRVEKQTAQAHREEFLQRCLTHHAHLARGEVEELQTRLRELAARIAETRRRGGDQAALASLQDEHLRLTEEKQALARAGTASAAARSPKATSTVH